MVDRIRALIAETERWRADHLNASPRRGIEALACNIRIKALEEALAIVRAARGDTDA